MGALLGNFWLFSVIIFAVNLLTAAVATMLLPSMIVPFAGSSRFLVKDVA